MKLNSSNYYSAEANREYFSVSQFKDFINCEAAALATIKGEYKKTATKSMLVGTYVDAYFEGSLKEFTQSNPCIYTAKKDLKIEFKKAEEIIKRVQRDPLFMKFMSGEKQKILTFEMFDIKWKMKMDSFIDNICIADLKIVSDFKSIPKWRYDIQGAIYQKGVEIALKEKLPFYLVVATKENVVDLDIFQIPQSILDSALEDVEIMIDRFQAVKNGKQEPIHCGICDYCKKLKRAGIRNYMDLLN